MIRRLLLLALCLPAASWAQSRSVSECASLASSRSGVPAIVLAVVIAVEGGWSGAEVRNTNGTHDLGVAQINTVHLPTFARMGITREQLRDDNCVNLAAAAYLLAGHRRHTENWGQAITRYHSKTPEHAARYAARARGALARIARNVKASSPATTTDSGP